MSVLHILGLLCLHLFLSSTAVEQFVKNEIFPAVCLNYTLSVYTGDGSTEGTTNLISVVLHGVDRASELVPLNRLIRLRRGSVHEFPLKLSAPLGDIIVMEVRSTQLLRIHDKWRCQKITVQACEDDMLLFPCYRWFHDQETEYLRPSPAKFEFQDAHPIGQKQRRMELEKSRNAYRWAVYIDGVPETVSAETTQDLPLDAQYSVKMAKDVRQSLQQTNQDIEHLADSREQWDYDFTGLEDLLPGNRSQTYKYVKEHWTEDEFFGYQFLNGLNPMMIQRCSRLPKNFPVTEEMVRDSLGGSTLEQEMKNGNIFLVDYKMLDGLVGSVVHDRQTYIPAPLVLLYSNTAGQMMPIAIQLTQETAVPNACSKGQLAQSPIFLPTDGKYDWLLAKLYVRVADFIMNEFVSYLLRTHFLAEVFSMATLRNLPSTHPLYKLITPHTRYTLMSNVLSRSRLVNDDGTLGKFSGVGGETLAELLKRATASLTYSSLSLPDDLAERGLTTVPNYYYRDDGLQLWNITNRFVDGVLTHYYISNEVVHEDAELQNWISDIFNKGFLGRSQMGIPQFFSTRTELVKFVTMVIFTASAQHAALHNRRFDLCGWVPNCPFAPRRPPPTEKGHATMATILETLADKGSTAHVVALMKRLAENFTDLHPLGYFPEELFGEEVPLKLIKTFQSDLKVLSRTINKRNSHIKRNSHVKLPYTPLHPKNIVNSVSH